MDELLAACWEETLAPSQYALGDSPLDWGKVLRGDRFFVLLMVRVLTYGPEYAFSLQCRNDSCRARFEWELDLQKLPVPPLSEESRAAFVAGNRFQTTLFDAGKRVCFKLLTGEDERRLPQLQRAAPDRLLSSVLAYRVIGIDGVDPRDKRRFLKDLSLLDADFLFDEFDRVDCGVDTTLKSSAPSAFSSRTWTVSPEPVRGWAAARGQLLW